MNKIYDMCVATRRYKDSSGNEKAVWENVGSVLEKDGKQFIMLKAHFNPAAIQRKDGSECILISLFAPKNSNDSLGFSHSQDTFAGSYTTTKLFNLCVAIRHYKDTSGNEKTVWENIGSLLEKDGRKFIMLKAHFNPAGIQRKDGSESVLVSLFAPKEKDNGYSTQSQDFDDAFAPQAYNPDDPNNVDVPF